MNNTHSKNIFLHIAFLISTCYQSICDSKEHPKPKLHFLNLNDRFENYCQEHCNLITEPRNLETKFYEPHNHVSKPITTNHSPARQLWFPNWCCPWWNEFSTMVTIDGDAYWSMKQSWGSHKCNNETNTYWSWLRSMDYW